MNSHSHIVSNRPTCSELGQCCRLQLEDVPTGTKPSSLEKMLNLCGAGTRYPFELVSKYFLTYQRLQKKEWEYPSNCWTGPNHSPTGLLAPLTPSLWSVLVTVGCEHPVFKCNHKGICL